MSDVTVSLETCLSDSAESARYSTQMSRIVCTIDMYIIHVTLSLEITAVEYMVNKVF